jgi:carbonic anhydrase/SulP family sulfate permease
MTPANANTSPVARDLVAGLVVFLVAIPLCLGIAHASGVPAIAGIIAGTIGGIVVGALSGSHLSVSGPAAGLTAIVLAAMERLGSFDAFLAALLLSGLLQIVLGFLKAGLLANYFPTNVIKGLLASIGIILIIKQLPHLVGHDPDYEGDFAFNQNDGRTSFSELLATIGNIQPGAALIGLLCLALLLAWDRSPLKKSLIPAPLAVVALGALLNLLFQKLGLSLAVGTSHLVQVPEIPSLAAASSLLHWPDFSAFSNPAIYATAATLAIVASLETLLNLEATDKLDPLKRVSPPNRELFAQGAGNLVCGLIGGMPVTSVIVRSSVNANAGAVSKRSAIFHGFLLAVSVLFAARLLNTIPLSALAAILVVTGFKLAKPAVFRDMFRSGWSQFLPFALTIAAIVFTDLLTGVIIGLLVSATFILHNNLRLGFHVIRETHASGPVTRIEFADQITFLNRAALASSLASLKTGDHVVLDARTTNYIDPDILGMVRDFRNEQATERGIQVSTVGFKDRYAVADEIQYVDVSTRDIQRQASPLDIIRMLKEGNQRFVAGQRLNRDLVRQVNSTADAQHPLAVVLGCIDSRASTELIFDVGLGDIFCIRIAGNVAADKVLASMEYACQVAGAKVIVVKGHTRCGAVAAACNVVRNNIDPALATGCAHLSALTNRIGTSVHAVAARPDSSSLNPEAFADLVAEENVRRTMAFVRDSSPGLASMITDGRIALVGAMYDVRTGILRFLDPIPDPAPLPAPLPAA